MLLAVCHSSATGWTKVDDLDTLSDLRGQGGNLLWAEADVDDLTPADVALIADEFGLHELAVEDAEHMRQRPKCETYADHLFIVLHQLDESDGQFDAAQLACFVGERFVLTIHHGAERTLKEAKARWSAEEDDERGPGHLLHTLLDVIVDDYQKRADALELEIEHLEEAALASIDVPQQQLYRVKQRLARMRRFGLPVSRVLEDLMADRSGNGIIEADTLPHFRDVHDHTIRIESQIRNIDELSDAVLDLVRAEQAARLNDNSRKLAAWAAIFGIATVIAGIYGMNFELVPEDQELFGFWFALGLMGVICGGTFLYFRRKGWL